MRGSIGLGGMLIVAICRVIFGGRSAKVVQNTKIKGEGLFFPPFFHYSRVQVVQSYAVLAHPSV